MNSTLTLNPTIVSAPPSVSAPAVQAQGAKRAAKALSVSDLKRTLVHKWDMLAVIGLMGASAVYGVYAITQMTGF